MSYTNGPLSSITFSSLLTLFPIPGLSNTPTPSSSTNTGSCSFKSEFTILNSNNLDNLSELFNVVKK